VDSGGARDGGVALPQPDARALAILGNEDYASRFKGGPDCVDRAPSQWVPAFQPRDRIGGNTGNFREFANAQTKSRSSHLALNGYHFVTSLQSSGRPRELRFRNTVPTYPQPDLGAVDVDADVKPLRCAG
jgi:hypothetical protein